MLLSPTAKALSTFFTVTLTRRGAKGLLTGTPVASTKFTVAPDAKGPVYCLLTPEARIEPSETLETVKSY